MGVIISREFHRSLQVDGSVKAKAWDFVTKLSNDADLTGLDLKIPKGAADRKVRTGRVDINYRAVVFAAGDGPEPMWVLAAVLPHDEAYARATEIVYNINPSNGAMEIYTPTAVEVSVESFRHRPVAERAAQVLPFTVGELSELGIDAAVAAEATKVTGDGELLELIEALPEWQQQALLDLATGKALDDVRATYGAGDHVSDDPVAAARRPASRMEFVHLDSDEELRRMLEGDFAEWRTFLHPTQRGVAYRRVYNGPFRLAGGAGTGKTVVALHRAAHLVRRDPEVQVLMCTFTRNLAARLDTDVRGLLPADAVSRVTVRGVDQLVHRIVSTVDGRPGQFLGDRERDSAWAAAVRTARVPEDLAALLTPSFLGDEFRCVVLGLPEHTRQSYLTVKRPGRGVRLNRAQRTVVWRVFETFANTVTAQGRTAPDLLAFRAAQIVADPGHAAAIPRYDHVVVDEGQDLHAAHWQVLRTLVPRGPDDLFICEDGHQRIYGERVVLSHFGIETRGRSRRLTLNYRTSRQNLALAMGVIGDEQIVDLDGEAETVAGYRSAFSGPVPILRGFRSLPHELHGITEIIREWIDEVAPAEIAVLTRRASEQERVCDALRRAGVSVETLARNDETDNDAVKVASMHRAKGTEFRRVVVAAASADVVPLPYVFTGKPGSEHTAIRARERSLLYVACSRARDQLVITWSGAPSPFLPVTG